MSAPHQPHPLRSLERYGVIAPAVLKRIHQPRHNSVEGEEPHQASPRQPSQSTIGEQNDMSNNNNAATQNNETATEAAKKPEPMLVEARLNEERSSGVKPNIGIDIEVRMAKEERTFFQQVKNSAPQGAVIFTSIVIGVPIAAGIAHIAGKALSSWFGGGDLGDIDAG